MDKPNLGLCAFIEDNNKVHTDAMHMLVWSYSTIIVVMLILFFIYLYYNHNTDTDKKKSKNISYPIKKTDQRNSKRDQYDTPYYR